MALNIHNLIAAVVPKIYCDPSVSGEVAKIAEKDGYTKAAEKAKPLDPVFMDLQGIGDKNAISSPGLKAPIEKHTLIYDSFGEGLEAVYFWIVDKMGDEYKKVDKMVDNFVSAPGSGHFSEMGIKSTKMQEEGMKMLGAANQVIKSILNIIYDLREFKLRLETYDIVNNEQNSEKKNAAFLSLKQLWMDTVDMKKGNSALLMMARNFDYVTLINGFMAARTPDDVIRKPDEDGLDLNDQVRRILQQRVPEFFRWVKESEIELRKRYEIERIYLRSQVNTVKLYARWAKPYLRAAQKLEQNASPTASLVNTFNTTLYELMLFGEAEYKPDEDISRGELPKIFKDATKKKYSPVLIVELKFRSMPERTNNQGYGFRGKAEVVFTSYALNDSELAVVRAELAKDDVNDVLKLVEGATTESLDRLAKDLDEFVSEEKKEAKKEEEKKDESNPFTALISLFKREKKEDKGENKISADNNFEKVIRSQTIIEARRKCYKVYDSYKKGHKMATLPG